jgi:alpha-1,2-mannosyltransferase
MNDQGKGTATVATATSVPKMPPFVLKLLERFLPIRTDVLAAAGAVAWFVAFGFCFLWSHSGFLDLQIYMAAGHNVLLGRVPYDVGYTSAHLDATYPPFGLLIVSPLSLLDTTTIDLLWFGANVASLVAIVSLALRDVTTWDRRRRLAAAAVLAGLATLFIEPVRSDFNFGQINILLMALVVLDVCARRNPTRGVLIGLAGAVKFTPLIFVLLFLLKRDWRSALRAVLTFLALTAGAFAVMPSASARYFTHFSEETSHIGSPLFRSNQSWSGILHRAHLFPHGTLTLVAFLLDVVTVAGATFLAHRLLRGPSVIPPLFVLALAGLLCSPISWTHHWSWVVLAPVVAASAIVPRGIRVGLGVIVLVAVAYPYWWLQLGPLTQLAEDTLALSAIVLLAGWVVIEWRSTRTTSTVASGGGTQTTLG